MASGQTLCVFTPACNEPPSANFATLDLRNGHPVLDFDAAADESAVFTGCLPRNYAGNGLTVRIAFAASSATSGTVRWQGQFERIDDEGLDIDADSFATAQSVGAGPGLTNGMVQYVDLVFTSAQIDGLLAGEWFRFKLTRDADGTSGTDDMTGDAELVGIEIRET